MSELEDAKQAIIAAARAARARGIPREAIVAVINAKCEEYAGKAVDRASVEGLIAAVVKAADDTGAKGDKGDVGPMPEHEWEGTKLRFQQGPDGAQWGEFVDLKGRDGRNGRNGANGGAATATPQFGYMPQGWS